MDVGDQVRLFAVAVLKSPVLSTYLVSLQLFEVLNLHVGTHELDRRDEDVAVVEYEYVLVPGFWPDP